MIESVLGIIPARGGSKRLPGKNLRMIAGKSLLRITVEQAKKALPVCVVTTDDEKIILEALRCGVKALLRPAELATDDASSGDVVKHVIWTYPEFEWYCLLQPTSPCRTVTDILACIDLAEQSGKSVVSTYKAKPNGAVYVGRTWKFSGDFWGDAVHYEMPKERSIDIDTLADFNEAERVINGNLVRVTPDGEVLQDMRNF